MDEEEGGENWGDRLGGGTDFLSPPLSGRQQLKGGFRRRAPTPALKTQQDRCRKRRNSRMNARHGAVEEEARSGRLGGQECRRAEVGTEETARVAGIPTLGAGGKDCQITEADLMLPRRCR